VICHFSGHEIKVVVVVVVVVVVTRQKCQIFLKMLRTLKPTCVLNLVPLSLVSLDIYQIYYFNQ